MGSREEFMRQMGISMDDVKDPTNVKTKYPSKVTLEEGGGPVKQSSYSSPPPPPPRSSYSSTNPTPTPTSYASTNTSKYASSSSKPSAPAVQSSGPGYMSYSESQMSPMKATPTTTAKSTNSRAAAGGGGFPSARDDFLRSLGIDNMETPDPAPMKQQPAVASRASQEYARPGARPAAVCSQESDDSTDNYRTMAPRPQPDVMLGMRRATSSMLPTSSSTPTPTTSNKPFSMMDKDLEGLGAEEVKNLGNKAFEDGDFRKAVRLYSRAIEMDPRSAALYSNRSACYLQAAKQMGIDTRTMALRDADKVIEIRPDWFKGYSRRGDALFKLERFSEAAIAYERGLALDPNNSNLMHSLGEARNSAGGIGSRTQANSWSTKAVQPGEPLRNATGKSARELLEEMKTSMRREASECVMIGDDYRDEELRRYRERSTSSLGNTNTSTTASSSTRRQNTTSVDQAEYDYSRSNSRLDRSQIPDEFSSSVAAAYQQNLLEEYRRKKAAKNTSAAYQTY